MEVILHSKVTTLHKIYIQECNQNFPSLAIFVASFW